MNFEISPGTVLKGTYRLDRRLGAGGMGEVWEASHARLPGPCAVKILLQHLCDNPEAQARFHREADIMAELRHPNIVQVFDYNVTEAGVPFFAMERLLGETLDTRLARGPMSLADTAIIAAQIAAGLSAAHKLAVVHRDLKPENIFLTQIQGRDDPMVKLLDFGISKMKSDSNRLTGASQIVGTPQYMAPEQAMGRLDQADGRTDQFALAGITFVMLTGTDAFVADDFSGMLYQVVHEPPRQLAAYVPWDAHGVQAVLDRGFQKSRERRFPSILDFGDALAAEAAKLAIPEIGGPAPLRRLLLSKLARSFNRTPSTVSKRPTAEWQSPTPQAMAPLQAATPVTPAAPVTAAAPVTPVDQLTETVVAPGPASDPPGKIDRIPHSWVRMMALGAIAVSLALLVAAKGWQHQLLAGAQAAWRRAGFGVAGNHEPAAPPTAVVNNPERAVPAATLERDGLAAPAKGGEPPPTSGEVSIESTGAAPTVEEAAPEAAPEVAVTPARRPHAAAHRSPEGASRPAAVPTLPGQPPPPPAPIAIFEVTPSPADPAVSPPPVAPPATSAPPAERPTVIVPVFDR